MSRTSAVRVCHLLDHSLPVHSGYAFRSHAILSVQRRRGWAVTVLTSPKHHESRPEDAGGSQFVDGIEYQRSGGTRRRGWPGLDEALVMARMRQRLARLVRQTRPTVLHAHSPVLNALPALAVGRAHRVPIVYEMRALWEDAGVDHGTYRAGSSKYRLARTLETWVCRHADHVVVISSGLREDLGARGVRRERITVVPNGVDVEAFRPTAPDEALRRQWNLAGRRVLAFMGSFFRYEGLDLLLKVMARVVPLRPDIALLLIGGGRAEPELRAEVARLGLHGSVIFTGSIAHDRMPAIYSLTDILVYPRHSNRLTELVTPLKPLEAMATGKPVLASDVGGHRELIRDGETGLLFRAGDVTACATALLRLLDDETLRKDLADQSLDWVRQHRVWEVTTAPYSEVYGAVVKRD
jgi:PEP-CTERM/exosortase A-associated glycosyltransferase